VEKKKEVGEGRIQGKMDSQNARGVEKKKEERVKPI